MLCVYLCQRICNNNNNNNKTFLFVTHVTRFSIRKSRRINNDDSKAKANTPTKTTHDGLFFFVYIPIKVSFVWLLALLLGVLLFVFVLAFVFRFSLLLHSLVRVEMISDKIGRQRNQKQKRKNDAEKREHLLNVSAQHNGILSLR